VENDYGIAEIFLWEPMEHGKLTPVDPIDPSVRMSRDFEDEFPHEYIVTDEIINIMPSFNSVIDG